MISIHAAREGGDGTPRARLLCGRISIHAAREGGDLKTEVVMTTNLRISIHAAREGGDGVRPCVAAGIAHFNPRRP